MTRLIWSNDERSGLQPMSYALRIVWTAAFGVAKIMSVSAPDPCSATTCESTVGSDTSYETSLTIIPA